MTPVLTFQWDGEAMVPKHPRLADKHYVVGESYPLVIHEERSGNSHRHYFASVHEAWSNLPEDEAIRFPTSEHLRKWALVKAGYADERSIVCASKAEALRLAAFMRPMDEYAIVVTSEATIKVFTPKSQSVRAMGKKDFQDSKTKVLEIVWGLVGVAPDEAAKHVGKAA